MLKNQTRFADSHGPMFDIASLLCYNSIDGKSIESPKKRLIRNLNFAYGRN